MKVPLLLPNGNISLAFKFCAIRLDRRHPADWPQIGPLQMESTFFSYVLSSSNRVVGPDWEYTIDPGDLLLINEQEQIKAFPKPTAELHVINLHLFLSDPFKSTLHRHLPRIVRSGQTEGNLRDLLEKIMAAQSLGQEKLRDLSVSVFLIELAKIRLNLMQQQLSPTARKALEYIEDFGHRPLRRDEVAAHCEVSSSYLSTLIKQETGYSLRHHVDHARAAYAKELMHTTGMNFTQIADAIEMDPYTFSKFFKRTVGITPSKYCRQTHFSMNRSADKTGNRHA